SFTSSWGFPEPPPHAARARTRTARTFVMPARSATRVPQRERRVLASLPGERPPATCDRPPNCAHDALRGRITHCPWYRPCTRCTSARPNWLTKLSKRQRRLLVRALHHEACHEEQAHCGGVRGARGGRRLRQQNRRSGEGARRRGGAGDQHGVRSGAAPML